MIFCDEIIFNFWKLKTLKRSKKEAKISLKNEF